jgi:3-oxoacyl-(acyl-carrier-protein) synthase
MTRQRPIAVIGLGLRLPCGGRLDDLWSLIEAGRDTVRKLPSGRWDSEQHPTVPAMGNFLDDLQGFDAAFFQIDDASKVDPQHRLLLEVAYEALEDAGVPLDEIAGTDAAVFTGIARSDHAEPALANVTAVDASTNPGLFTSFAANRVSHAFDLRGPSFTIDSACASSAIALHLACQTLAAGETHIALVGGANAIASAAFMRGFDAMKTLSPDGITRSFDARGQGYGRGEGAAMVVLKTLDDALANGDRIHAVLRGSSVAQKGRANGLLGPSRAAQEQVLRTAVARAHVSPRSVRFVEGMGTGSPISDAVELGAVDAALGEGHGAERPLWITSVKANLGHLDPVSGLVGLAKVIACLQQAALPPQAHFAEPNRDFDWDTSRVRVPTTRTALLDEQEPIRAAILSTAVGGSHAAFIVEAAPAPKPRPRSLPRPGAVLVSARSREALFNEAARLATALETGLASTPLVDVAASLATRRTHHNHRAALVARDHAQAADELRALASGSERPGIHTSVFKGRRDGVLLWVGDATGASSGDGSVEDDIPALATALHAFDDALTRRGLAPLSVFTAESNRDRARAALAARARAWTRAGLPVRGVAHRSSSAASWIAAYAEGLVDETLLLVASGPAPSTRLALVDAEALASRRELVVDLGAGGSPPQVHALAPHANASSWAEALARLWLGGSLDRLARVHRRGHVLALQRYAWTRARPAAAMPDVPAAPSSGAMGAPYPPNLADRSADERLELVGGYLLELLREATGKPIQLEDRPADLGLDSLAATALSQRVAMAMGATFSLASAFGGATIRALAAEVVGQLPAGPA